MFGLLPGDLQSLSSYIPIQALVHTAMPNPMPCSRSYVGNPAHRAKSAEHGGINEDDQHVALMVSA